MSDAWPPSMIRDAFPTIPARDVAALFPGIFPDSPVAELLQSDDPSPAFESVADWILRHPSFCLGSTLPGLWLARDDAIQVRVLPGRVASALARLSVTVWGDVIELTPSVLLDIRGFGEGSLRTFLAEAARTATEACSHAHPPARPPVIDAFEARRFSPRAAFRTAMFRQVVEWAAREDRATTLGEVLAACSAPHCPQDIAELCEALRVTSVAEVFPAAGHGDPLADLVDDLLGVLDRRGHTIFLGRISLNHCRTLDDLATEIGVSKERVRQLSVRAEERVRAALATHRFAPVNWRAHALRVALGTAVPADGVYLAEATGRAMEGVPEPVRERVLDLLLWLAGPYSLSPTNWLRAGELPGPELIDACADESGRVDMDSVRQRLSNSGLLSAVHEDWLDRVGRVRNVEDTWLVWSGTVADKAVRLLEMWGRPATPDEIVAAIGEGYEARSTRARLYEDERLMRVDMTRVGLRCWGMEEYSSIAEEIDQELDRRGGTADLDHLAGTLVERFGIRENSVKFYMNAPMFVVEGGQIRRRTSADPFDPVAPVTATAGCYLLSPDTLVWRLEVNADTLRGSGRPMPAPIAAWLGVMPGGRRALAAAAGTVNVTWPMTSTAGPALGSIRSLVVQAGADAGDQVLIRFRRDSGTVELTRIDAAEVSAAQGMRRLSLLTGIQNGEGERTVLRELGQALATQASAAAVSGALRRRGESELATLVPADDDSPDLDVAIDALRGLL